MARKGGNPALEKYKFQMPEGRSRPFKTRLTLSVTQEVKDELRKHLGKDMSEYCREAIFERMRKDGMEVKI